MAHYHSIQEDLEEARREEAHQKAKNIWQEDLKNQYELIKRTFQEELSIDEKINLIFENLLNSEYEMILKTEKNYNNFKGWQNLIDGKSIDPINDGEIPNLNDTDVNKANCKNEKMKLPEQSDNFRRLYGYLIKTAGIEKSIVDHYVYNQKIYEDCSHNIVFCGLDENGNIQSAYLHGTNTLSGDKPFQDWVKNSNESYLFTFDGNSDRLMIFETPIDMMSYQTMEKVSGEYQKNNKTNAIVLNSYLDGGVIDYLENNPTFTNVIFAPNNHESGYHKMNKIAFAVRDLMPDLCNVDIKASSKISWNEDLKEHRMTHKDQVEDLEMVN